MAKPYQFFTFTDLAKSMPMQPDDMPDGEDMPSKKKHRPFDGMAAGEFTDMYGMKASFKKEDLPTYVKNTKAVLASTKDANGDVVGLPIDAMNHDHREAAGWLVDVELSESGNTILFTPRWNDAGLEMIESDTARFFSPSVNLKNKSIMGGSLTNWPATRDATTGKILLRPIELSTQMYELTDESLIDRANRIARAFRDTFRDSYEADYAWPVDVFDGYIICEMGEKLYKVDFTEKAGGFEFAEFADWVEVKRAYVEAAMQQFRNWNFGLFETVSNGGEPSADQTETGVFEMELTEQELTDRITNAVAVALAAQKPAPDPKAVDLSTLLDLDGLSEEAKKQRKAELTSQLAAIRKQAELEYRAEMIKLEFENRMTDLSQALVTGSDKAPRGLRVSAEELKAHLCKMEPDEAKFWGDLLTKTVEQGLVEYAEMGHGRTLQGTRILDPKIGAQLKSWIAAGQSIDEFFRVNAVELGNMADYNLAEYQGKEK